MIVALAASALIACGQDDTRMLVLAVEYATTNQALLTVDGERTFVAGADLSLADLRAATNSSGFAAWMLARNTQPDDHPRGVAVPDPARPGVMVSLVPIEGDVVPVDAHASPFDPAKYANGVAAHTAVRREIMAEFRAERKSITNEINDAQALIDSAQVGIVTNGFTTAAQRNVITFIRSNNVAILRDRIDVLRLQRDIIGTCMDSLAGTNRPSRGTP